MQEAFKSKRKQNQPESARSIQEQAGANSNQKMHEQPDADGSSQKQQEAHTSNQEQPKQPEATKSNQEPPGARSTTKQPLQYTVNATIRVPEYSAPIYNAIELLYDSFYAGSLYLGPVYSRRLYT